MPPPSAAILTRLRELVAVDGRSPEALSVAMGLSRAYLRRRLAAGDGLRLADLDIILDVLGADLSALVGAPPCPSLSATNARPSSTEPR